MRFVSLIAATVIGLACSTALAHDGPRIWIGSSGGKLMTFIGNNNTNPAVYTPHRVFLGGADEDTLVSNGQLDEYPVPGTGIFATEFPGYRVRLDGNAGFGTGRSFGFMIPGPLLSFNPASRGYQTVSSLYSGAGAVPQMSQAAGSSVSTADGAVGGFNFYSYNTSGDHAHLVSALLGDGINPVDGPHAMYALPLRLTSSGMSDSLTYYIIFSRGIPQLDSVFADALQIGSSVLIATPGDANVDGKVDALDLGALANHWQGGSNWAGGDFNFDGKVDISDLYLLATNWHSGTAALSTELVSLGLPSTTVPEPTMLCYGIVAMMVVCRRSTDRRLRAIENPKIGELSWTQLATIHGWSQGELSAGRVLFENWMIRSVDRSENCGRLSDKSPRPPE